MRMLRHPFFALVLFVLSGLAVAPPAAFPESLKVGAVLALTGLGQQWGENARAGIELALDDVNQVLPAAQRLSVVFEDSLTASSSGISAYRKLIEHHKVQVIVGDVWAYLTAPLIPLSARDKVVLISPTVMDLSIPSQSPYFFTFGHRFSSLEAPFEKFFEIHPSLRKVGALSFDDYWNNAFVSTFEAVVKKRGVSLAKSIRLNEFLPDFRAEVWALKSSEVDSVLATWRPEIVLKRMKESRLSVPFICSSDSVEALRIRSKDAGLFEGTYFVDWPASPQFREKFSRKFKREAMFEAHNAYEIIQALSKAAGLPGDDLRSKLLSVRYEGVAGPIDFSQAPAVNLAQARLYRVSKGEFVELR